MTVLACEMYVMVQVAPKNEDDDCPDDDLLPNSKKNKGVIYARLQVDGEESHERWC